MKIDSTYYNLINYSRKIPKFSHCDYTKTLLQFQTLHFDFRFSANGQPSPRSGHVTRVLEVRVQGQDERGSRLWQRYNERLLPEGAAATQLLGLRVVHVAVRGVLIHVAHQGLFSPDQIIAQMVFQRSHANQKGQNCRNYTQLGRGATQKQNSISVIGLYSGLWIRVYGWWGRWLTK